MYIVYTVLKKATALITNIIIAKLNLQDNFSFINCRTKSL